jgi:hypothetical protein
MNTPLIAHWPLDGNARDLQNGLNGAPYNVTWVEGPSGRPCSAALFNGRDSVIAVNNAPQLQLGCDEFSISAWIRCAKPMRGAFGDVLSKFDAERRCGLNISVSGGSTCYGSNSDARHLHAGIDDGYLGAWSDHGRPGLGNPLVSCLTVYEGELYAGLSDAQTPEEACKVFRWDGEAGWSDCGRVSDDLRCPSVMSMIVHDGHLYAGTGAWDWGRAEAARDAVPPIPLTRVFRYEGGTTWRDMGAVGHGQRVLTLASFEGELYAGLDAGGKGECYVLRGERWEHVGGTDDGGNFECLMPVGGVLYGASHHAIYRYDGDARWTTIGFQPFDITQIHAFQVMDGKLWIGTWPQGYVLRLEDDGRWTNTGKIGLDVGRPGVAAINEINSLGVHNGKLYAGVLPKAQIYRYESDGHWTLLGSFASTPDWNPELLPTWMRILSLSTHRGRLFTCTGTCMARHQDLDPDLTAGRVLSCQAGIVASHEHDLGDAWTHVAIVRQRAALELYVNGKLAQSTAMPAGHHFHLGNAVPLLIGSGAQSSFDGAISDVRLYGAALDEAQVSQLSR